ncbi:MAG: MerR family transcriptional regulator [Gammaproteobacteria bacterium]
MTTALTIQQTAERSGLTVHTLRYYERIGLIKPVARRANGHRLYSPQDLDWIAFLLRLRATGMPIEQMRRYAQLREIGNEPGSLAERRAMLERHADGLQERINELQDTLGYLHRKIDHYASMENQHKETA